MASPRSFCWGSPSPRRLRQNSSRRHAPLSEGRKFSPPPSKAKEDSHIESGLSVILSLGGEGEPLSSQIGDTCSNRLSDFPVQKKCFRRLNGVVCSAERHKGLVSSHKGATGTNKAPKQ